MKNKKLLASISFIVILTLLIALYYSSKSTVSNLNATTLTSIVPIQNRFIYPPSFNGFTIEYESTFPANYSQILSKGLIGSYLVTYKNTTNSNYVILRLLSYNSNENATNAFNYIKNFSGVNNVTILKCFSNISSNFSCFHVNQTNNNFYVVDALINKEVFTATYLVNVNINTNRTIALLISMINKAYENYSS